MNNITITATVFTLWLVMGLGFLSKYAHLKKQGVSRPQPLKTIEGILFIASLFVPVIIVILKMV